MINLSLPTRRPLPTVECWAITGETMLFGAMLTDVCVSVAVVGENLLSILAQGASLVKNFTN
jgi:hypothetical protein